jgi:hypothetical protein
MTATLYCRRTQAREVMFIDDNWSALAEWERDHSWGSLTIRQIHTMQDLMERKIRDIAEGFTHRGSMQGNTAYVNGIVCYLKTEYDMRTLRTHFYLRSSCERWSANLILDDRDML